MLRLIDIRLNHMPLQARMPFRYGIAELTELPHLFLTLEAEFDGQHCCGIAADHLPPRWFTKDPSQSPTEEIDAMLRVIRHAASQAVGATAESPFDWWLSAYEEQMTWADRENIPHLLAQFGVSLAERAILSAVCHASQTPFHQLLLSGKLGFAPERVYPELAGSNWRAAFPDQPRQSVFLRHTVGLSDPIRQTDIPSDQHLSDGLPQSLEASIRTYALRHFKIKLAGNLETDRARLAAALRCIEACAINRFAFSIDGNESYPDFESFREQWIILCELPELHHHFNKLLFVEQPVRRDVALNRENAETLLKVAGTPIIIDESDADLHSLPTALDLGYAGTSHKNCKGVFKGLAAKCLLAMRQQRRTDSSPPLRHTGEDLSNIGPIALLQDLTVMASLDIPSVERNGHHYFTGLQAFNKSVNQDAVRLLPSLYQISKNGFATLAIDGGQLRLHELLRAPFAPHFPTALALAEEIPLHGDRGIDHSSRRYEERLTHTTDTS